MSEDPISSRTRRRSKGEVGPGGKFLKPSARSSKDLPSVAEEEENFLWDSSPCTTELSDFPIENLSAWNHADVSAALHRPPIPFSICEGQKELIPNDDDVFLDAESPRTFSKKKPKEVWVTSTPIEKNFDKRLSAALSSIQSHPGQVENTESEDDICSHLRGQNEGLNSLEHRPEGNTPNMTGVNHHKSALLRGEMFIEDDIETLTMESATTEVLTDLLNQGRKIKAGIQEAVLYFTNEGPEYLEQHQASIRKVKQRLTKFINECMAVITSRRTAPEGIAAGSNAEAKKIKAARVTEYRDPVSEDVASIVTELRSLNLVTPGDDAAYYDLKDKLDTVLKRSASIKKTARSLCDDAVEVGMSEAALGMEKNLRELHDLELELDVKISECKATFGIQTGPKFTAKGSAIKLPEFKGELTDGQDYYSFHDNFLEYCRFNMISKAEQLRILQKSCLKGDALEACEDLDTIEEVWAILKENFGNPKILLAAKEKEILKYGACKDSWPANKKRTWGFNVKSKLTKLQKMAVKHGLESHLYFSQTVVEIRHSLPSAAHKDFLDDLKKQTDLNPATEKQKMFELLLEFLQKFINDNTFQMSYDEEKPIAKAHASEPPNQKPKKAFSVNAAEATPTHQSKSGNKKQSGSKGNKQMGSKTPNLVNCSLCNGQHTHLFYCSEFMSASIPERFPLTQNSKTCFRCLRLDSEVDFSDRTAWFKKHEKDCITDFSCPLGKCGKLPASKQVHFTMCKFHKEKNESETLKEFKKSLDPAQLPPTGAKYFFVMPQHQYVMSTQSQNTAPVVKVDKEGYDILPDVDEPSIFMLQTISTEPGTEMLVFYDSGCSGAGMSDRACKLLETTTVRSGPTVLNVAGGTEVTIPHGDEQFHLPLYGTKKKATLTALHIPNITSDFQLWQLKAAWDDLNRGYKEEFPEGPDLPSTEDKIGGVPVDLMIGIKYNKYYPNLLYSLPSGLSIYKAQFTSARGNQGILGGVHSAWRTACSVSVHMGFRAYFTAEARAYSVQNATMRFCALPTFEEETVDEDDTVDTIENENLEIKCSQSHCDKHSVSDWIVPARWDLDYTIYNVREQARRFQTMEDLGTTAEYRCVACRNCSRCRNGDELEKTSLKEENEQYLIESSVTLDVENSSLVAKLPFIEDPNLKLKPNRYVAEKILESQLKIINKSDQMKEDTLKSHNKLADRGYVAPVTSLTAEERECMRSGQGYVIPWRTRYKDNSMSTPLRLVFDAGSRCPGGESLNDILAKGQNKLIKIFDILVRFRRKKCAVASDVSMAYNGLKLTPDFFRYQQYLWKPELNPDNPTVEMVVKTLIYGVRPSGNQTMAGFALLANHCLENYPEHATAAAALKEDAYMDDILTTADTPEDCKKLAHGIEFILGKGSMGVKAFTFSGEEPSDKVSADGSNIGLLGYLWDPVKDEIKLDIKELYFGKAKRGKLPEKVKGNLKDALKLTFNRRTLSSKLGGAYDPLGLATPVIAKIKLDLHAVCKGGYGWDDQLPENILETWVQNITTLQDLRDVTFKRTVVPEDAANLDVELLVSVDASEKIAISAVHSRILKKDGTYHCQLIAGKSKVVTGATIPRAELKAAVVGATLGHVVKKNFGELCSKMIYVTDSSIVLYWINQDERPMKIAIRNGVIEIRRFSLPDQWYHVETQNNIADLGTRTATIEDISKGSEWQNGKPWMGLKFEEMPLRTAAEITCSSEEKRLANDELKTPDICGYVLAPLRNQVAERYSYSKYVSDPCCKAWPRAVGVLGLVFKFIDLLRNKKLKNKDQLRKEYKELVRFKEKRELMKKEKKGGKNDIPKKKIVINLEDTYTEQALRYFFLKGTAEVKHFCKEKDWKEDTVDKDGILHYSGRILDGQEITAVENTMTDLEPLSFVKPILDRYSPVSYSIMIYCHVHVVHHKNTLTTLRASREIAYILRGRDLAKEIRRACVYCRRAKKRLLVAEMGKLPIERLSITPPFFFCQVDLMGPFVAICEHNHRSSVKIWGVVFKDPASCAVSCHVMQRYNVEAFIQAYTRFSTRFGHPNKLFIDEGGQLVKACKEMEYNVLDLTKSLNPEGKIGIEYETCPVGGHNFHGMVERSILEMKRLFTVVYQGLKLDILGYETAFSWISNELNCLPICLGSRIDELGSSDLITPSRLIHGRNNKRIPSGPARIPSPSKLMAQMEAVFKSWWTVWKDEKLLDLIPQPNKWKQTGYQPKPGDIVIFLKEEKDVELGQPVWRTGRIASVEVGRDNIVRTVIIEYVHGNETTFRTTRRAVRRIAVLHAEDDLELYDELNEASKAANLAFYMLNSK